MPRGSGGRQVLSESASEDPDNAEISFVTRGFNNPILAAVVLPKINTERSEIIVRGELPADVRSDMELWAGCIAGALEESKYGSTLRAAGFTNIEIEPSRTHLVEESHSILSASIRANKGV